MENTETKLIGEFKGYYHFLSNFYLIPVEYEGVQYMSVEHAFQAAKTLVLEEKLRIKEARTPGLAKQLGRKATKRSDWEDVRISVMKEILRRKFSYPVMRALLLKTEKVPLLEGNTWHDQFWGSCTCPMHYRVSGENWLGKLLMEIRNEFGQSCLTINL